MAQTFATTAPQAAGFEYTGQDYSTFLPDGMSDLTFDVIADPRLKASKAPKVVKPTKPINPEDPPLALNGHWLRSERRRLHRSSSKICQALGVKESVLLAIEENGTMLPRSWLPKLSKLSFRVTWKPQD